MARWKLVAPHYLNVEGVKWEYSEIDRTTGKPRRAVFPVPSLLDPGDPADWNHRQGRDDGEVIVTNGGASDPRDIRFTGDPTPDMIPLDDEAKAISASFASRWRHPIESLPSTYSDALVEDFQKEIADLRTSSGPAKVEGMSELLTAMTAMMKQNQDILAALAAKPERRL